MILAIDIGNSNIVIGILEKQHVLFEERLSTNHSQTEVEYAIAIKNILDLNHIKASSLEGGILSSVVPPISSTVKRAAEKILGKSILQVGPGLKTGLNLKVDNPASLGSDRVVDAVAAIYHYPSPLILFDMGTATTISAIDHEGNYLGGVIIPGIKVSLDSLTQNTSQLPKISLEAPKTTICTNTVDSMKSGVIYGNASLIDGMIKHISQELEGNVTVVATGGLARFIIPFCKHKIIYDKNLLLKGLSILYQKNR